MFVVARHSPQVWRTFSVAQKTRIDLIMEGILISNAFATSDSNPYLNSEVRERSIDGAGNVGRDWNPNYREGMVGSVLMGVSYFGKRTGSRLRSWNRERFLKSVRRRKLRNLELTFSWGISHPESGAPSDDSIRVALKGWSYHGLRLDRPMRIYADLTRFTYGGVVSCGANKGQGVTLPDGTTAGRIADPQACAALPNAGRPGMLLEFDARDEDGPRSSALYALAGFRANLANQVALMVSGNWRNGRIAASEPATGHELMKLQHIGVDDLLYKIDNGYVSFANGELTTLPGTNDLRVLSSATPGPFGASIVALRSVWKNVVLRAG